LINAVVATDKIREENKEFIKTAIATHKIDGTCSYIKDGVVMRR